MKKKPEEKHGQHKHSKGKCVHKASTHKIHVSKHHK